MGASPSIEYPLGANVDVRYDGNQTTYFPAKIVKKHEYGRYDVKFESNGKIMTVFWDDIKSFGSSVQSSQNSPQYTSPTRDPSNHISTALNQNNLNKKLQENIASGVYDKEAKVFDISFNSYEKKQWIECIETIDSCLKQQQRIKLQLSMAKDIASFDISKLKRFEELVTAIGGDELCNNIILYNQQKASKHIILCIENAAKQKNNDLKYICALKSIDILPENELKEEKDNIWCKYGSHYKICMDLDYDELVTQNDEFGNEILNELALVLDINRSLININSTEKGSIIVECSVCAMGLLLTLFGVLVFDKLSYFIHKKWMNTENNGKGESLDLNLGEEVLVDWKNKMYEATIIEKFENMKGQWVKIRYSGNPFMFKNVERLEINSSRLHIKEPGYQYQTNLYPEKKGSVSFEVIPIGVD